MHFLVSLVFATASAGSLLDEPGVGGQFETARSVGMGGAQRAIADEIDAIYLNPAGMSVRPHYLIGGSFTWSPEPKEYVGSAAIVDSATTVVAAGLSYGFDRRDNNASGVMDIHRFHIAASYSLGGIVSIGIGLKYLTYKREHPARMSDLDRVYVYDPSAALKPVNGLDDLNLDVGLLVTPIPQLSIGVVGYNLIPKCDGQVPDKTGKNQGFPNNVPQGCVEKEIAPMAMALAAAVHIAGLNVDADAVFDFWSQPQISERFHFGAEYTLFDIVPLRAGFIVDRVVDENYWTAGAGVFMSQFGIDLGYRQGITDSNNRTLVASLKLTLN